MLFQKKNNSCKNNTLELQIEAGKATPAPPIGTSLGPTGINMGEFCSQFNEKTREMSGDIIPAVISILRIEVFLLF